MTDEQERPDPTVPNTEPTARTESPAESSDEPTVAGPRPDEPTSAETRPSLDGPTVYGFTAGEFSDLTAAESYSSWPPVERTDAEPPGGLDEPTIARPTVDEPTVAIGEPADPDGPTTMVGGQEATTTGPTVGGWPLDLPEPGELIWQSDPLPQPDPPPATRSPAYYLSLGAAVVLVVGLIAALAVLTVVRPAREVAGSARATQGIPEITPPSSSTPPPATTQPSAPAGPLAAIAKHPLSTATARMADSTCALPKFDVADDAQVTFFAATKTCADAAWRGTLEAAGLTGAVKLVTVVGAAKQTPCGELTPTSASTQCEDTVYMTPAHLRDTEQNGRYPGKYVGVFLREYAKAVQYTTGLAELVGDVTTGSAEDLDKRLAQQATCLAGMTSGALAGRGAVDTNITNEIRARLTTVDAPPDAGSWLDKGFTARQPAACNTWAG